MLYINEYLIDLFIASLSAVFIALEIINGMRNPMATIENGTVSGFHINIVKLAPNKIYIIVSANVGMRGMRDTRQQHA